MAFKVVPSDIELSAEDVQAFKIEGDSVPVEWSIKPPVGSIDRHGIYVAPVRKDLRNVRSVVVLAQTPDGTSFSTATIVLSDAPRQIFFLGWYGVAASCLLGVAVLLFWQMLNLPLRQPMVMVNPPIVTLDPSQQGEQDIQFTATVMGGTQNAVTWSSSDSTPNNMRIGATGVYRVPKVTSRTTVTVKATSVVNPDASNTSTIDLSPGRHLEILPQSSSAFTGQQIPFRVQTTEKGGVDWNLSNPAVGNISANGLLTVNSWIPQTQSVQVTATSKGAAATAISGAATVIVNAPFVQQSGNMRMLLFVMVMGALGSMLYYASSFVNYVGNRTFRASWSWFYVFRPVVGGILALVFFFIIGSGLISGTTTSDLMRIAMISSLVGLFSDKAVKKLSDILDVLLASKDDRKDKLPEDAKTAPTSSSGAAAKKPQIKDSVPPAVQKGQAATVKFNGSGFSAKSKIKVNGADATPKNVTADSFTLDFAATYTASDPVTILVTNEDGATVEFKLKVN